MFIEWLLCNCTWNHQWKYTCFNWIDGYNINLCTEKYTTEQAPPEVYPQRVGGGGGKVGDLTMTWEVMYHANIMLLQWQRTSNWIADFIFNMNIDKSKNLIRKPSLKIAETYDYRGLWLAYLIVLVRGGCLCSEHFALINFKHYYKVYMKSFLQ